METNKTHFYNWRMVLFTNIGMIILILANAISGYSHYIPTSVFGLGNFALLGISVLVTVVPMLISKSNNKWKNRFGYGIPALLLLTLPYFIYDFYTCTGKFCGLRPLFLGWACGLSAIIFALFYTIGIYSRTWNSKFVSFLSIIIPIIIVGGFWLLVS